MKKIIISVTNDLTTDQRVAKICNTFVGLDYDVILVGRVLNNSIPLERHYKTKRFKLLFNKGVLFYAEYNLRLFIFLLFSKKDMLWANDLDTLVASFLVSKLQKKQLIYDSHELFTEVPELIHRKFVKKTWEVLESWMFPKLQNVITVSPSIASFYNKKYKVSCKVIRNFPYKQTIIESAKMSFPQNKKILLYQGSVNIGRGLELAIETIKLLPNYILVIVGDGDIFENLKIKIRNERLHQKVFLLGKKTPAALKKITPLATVGISIEEDLGLNYRYALPNKMFDYIQANVPVITSNLPEMKNIIEKYNIGQVLFKRSPEALKRLVEEVSQNSYDNQLKKAGDVLHWKKEEEKLIHFIKTIS